MSNMSRTGADRVVLIAGACSGVGASAAPTPCEALTQQVRGSADAARQPLTRAAETTPFSHVTEPADSIPPIAFLLADKARRFTGQAIHVDGALAPG
jgi:NAD(P)-dependent dehydrogenase (short-subunit alcohol dehydrogenase family)